MGHPPPRNDVRNTKRKCLLPLWAAGLGAILAVAVSRPSSAVACTCVAPGDPATELAASAAVFLGRIESQERVAPRAFDVKGLVRYSVTIDRAWKGVTHPSIVVVTPSRGIDCTEPLAVGETYLLYAHRIVPRETHADHMVGLCSRSAHESEAAQELQFLASVEPTYAASADEVADFNGRLLLSGQWAALLAIALLTVLTVSGLRTLATASDPEQAGPRPRHW